MHKAVPVSLTAFYDLGFDPRFSLDGNTFYLQNSKNLCQRIYEFVVWIIFAAKAHLSLNAQERHCRQQILECAKIEETWSKCAQEDFIHSIPNREIRRIFVAEHDFLQKTDSLYRTVIGNSLFYSQRLFPSELLHPIHAINKPQTEDWSKESLRRCPEAQNLDLAREVAYGFARLSPSMVEHLPAQDKKRFYVPHAHFVQAIDPSSNALKESCRHLRRTLNAYQTDLKSALMFEHCMNKLQPALKDFKQSWENYREAHELLTEVSRPLIDEDYFHDYYEVLRDKSQMPLDAYIQWAGKKFGSSNHLEHEAEGKAYQLLKQAFIHSYPQTLTAQLYATARNQD